MQQKSRWKPLYILLCGDIKDKTVTWDGLKFHHQLIPKAWHYVTEEVFCAQAEDNKEHPQRTNKG